MTTSAPRNAREILMTFATEGEPTPKRLEAYAKDHPALRRELTELAVELVLDPARSPPATDATTERSVASAWARFQAGTGMGRDSQRPPERSRDIFAGFAGSAFPQLAARLGVSPVFLIKIRDGLIQAAGFPHALVKRIADEIGRDVEAVRAVLEGPASMPAGTMAKADGKPEAGAKQTFAEAVETSGLTPDQRQRLLDIAEAERGSD